PVMAPVLLLMCRPAGRPDAVKTGVPAESLHVRLSDTESPSALAWSLGRVSETGLLTFQVKPTWAVYVPSPARTVTLYGPPAAAPTPTVPVMAPVLLLMCRPAGRPEAA